MGGQWPELSTDEDLPKIYWDLLPGPRRDQPIMKFIAKQSPLIALAFFLISVALMVLDQVGDNWESVGLDDWAGTSFLTGLSVFSCALLYHFGQWVGAKQ